MSPLSHLVALTVATLRTIGDDGVLGSLRHYQGERGFCVALGGGAGEQIGDEIPQIPTRDDRERGSRLDPPRALGASLAASLILLMLRHFFLAHKPAHLRPS